MNIDLNKINKEKILSNLETFVDKVIDERNSLNEKLQSYNKDERISELLKANEELRLNSVHILSKHEKDEFKKFTKLHRKSCENGVRFIISSDNIGTDVTVQCKKCELEKNITDYSNW